MKIKKLNQAGVAALEIILIVFVILAVAGVGYYVWQAKAKTNKTLSDTAQGAGEATKTEKKKSTTKYTPTDETASWYLYTTPGKEYQLRLPDGWKLQRYQASSGIYANAAKDIVYAKGTLATVTQVEGGRDFAAVPFAVNYMKTTEISAPSGDKQALSLKTKDGLTVDKYKYVVPKDPEAIGPPKGTIEYDYRFTKGSYTVSVVHDIAPGETDQTQYVEKAIATFEFL